MHVKTNAEKTATGQAAGTRRTALLCAAFVGVMLGASYAAVPLYRIFCQVTGFGGTTQRAETASTQVLDRTILVRFDANVARGLPWEFEPVARTMEARLGENMLAFYRAKNVSDRPVKGTAAFNVTPDTTGIHFKKVECFCFTEQTLQPGEEVEMPVSFYVDAALAQDRDTRHVTQITLSYTFYPVPDPVAAAPAQTGPGG
jgi:cytochrome c oxidase assembly protein subunit 11